MNKKTGAITLLLVILFSGVSLVTVLGGLGSTSSLSARSQDTIDSKRTVLLADGLVDDVVYRLKSGKQVTDGEVFTIDDVSAGVRLVGGEGGVTTVTIFATSTDIARNVHASVSSLAPPTFVEAVIVGSGGLTMNANSTIIGSVHSNGNIYGNSNATITGDVSAVGTISSPSPSVGGQKTSSAPVITAPSIDEAYWKAQANINNDPLNGGLTLNNHQTAILGPRKIVGSVNLNSNTELTVTGPLHITGNLTLNSNSDVYLDDSLGTAGTVIIVDGTISLNSNSPVHSNSADPKGYIALVGLSSSNSAITLNSNASVDGLLVAPNGGVVMNSNSSGVAVIANRVLLNSNAEINFDGAIAERSYGGGTGGFTIGSWGEVQ